MKYAKLRQRSSFPRAKSSRPFLHSESQRKGGKFWGSKQNHKLFKEYSRWFLLLFKLSSLSLEIVFFLVTCSFLLMGASLVELRSAHALQAGIQCFVRFCYMITCAPHTLFVNSPRLPASPAPPPPTTTTSVSVGNLPFQSFAVSMFRFLLNFFLVDWNITCYQKTGPLGPLVLRSVTSLM